jgi:RNA polymerase sigma factor (sigma-70 family)
LNCCLERARDGDPTAVRFLIDDLRPRIYKMAAYYARRCGEDPDDLAQEAWLGLLEALPELDLSIGQPRHYLIARARWKMLDLVKRERVRRCLRLDEIPTDMACPRVLDEADGSAQVSEFVGHLKPTQRDVIECLLRGLTWREAGERLGCASANIAYHVRNIRRRYEEWV